MLIFSVIMHWQWCFFLNLQEVFDKDTFVDDSMGTAELDIRPLVEVVKMKLQDVADGTVVKKLVPNRQNCLAEESSIYISEGKVKQDLVIRLKNVECGEIELQLQWVDLPGSKGVWAPLCPADLRGSRVKVKFMWRM